MTELAFAKILDRAHDSAAKAVADLPDVGACGFAWVEIDKTERAFIKFCKKHAGGNNVAGYVSQRWYGSQHHKYWTFWNPGFYAGQSIDAIEAGAKAFAKVLNAYGIKAYANSRLD